MDKRHAQALLDLKDAGIIEQRQVAIVANSLLSVAEENNDAALALLVVQVICAFDLDVVGNIEVRS